MNPGEIILLTMGIEILLVFAYGLQNPPSDPVQDWGLYM